MSEFLKAFYFIFYLLCIFLTYINPNLSIIIKNKMMSPLYDCDSRYDSNVFGLGEQSTNEKNEDKDALNEMQLKIDVNAKEQKERLEVFASLLNESILKQNEENERFRQSIQYAVNMHLQTFIQSLQPAQAATKETELILKKAIDMLRLSKLSSEKLASLVQPLLSAHSVMNEKMTVLEQEIVQINKRVKILESSVKDLTDFDSFLMSAPLAQETNEPTQQQTPRQEILQQQEKKIEPKSKKSHKRKSPAS